MGFLHLVCEKIAYYFIDSVYLLCFNEIKLMNLSGEEMTTKTAA